MKLELSLSHIESYQDFIRNEKHKDKRGVYIWGFRFIDENDSPFRPYYVGKHESNIQRRIQEHFHGIRYGTHKVLKTEFLKSYQDYVDKETSDYYAYLHSENRGIAKIDLPIERQLEVLKHSLSYTDNWFITYLQTNDIEGVDQKDLIAFLEQWVKNEISKKHGVNGEIGKNRLSDYEVEICNSTERKEVFKY